MNEWMQAHPLVVCGVIGGLGLLLGVMLTLLVLLVVEEGRVARCKECEDVMEEKGGEKEEKGEDVMEESEEEMEESGEKEGEEKKCEEEEKEEEEITNTQ